MTPTSSQKKSFARFSGRDDTPTVRSFVAGPLLIEKTQSVPFREKQGSRLGGDMGQLRDISFCMERPS